MRFQSRMNDLGSALPAFRGADPSGQTLTDADVRGGSGVLVAFICNHCPFVLHLIDPFVRLANAYQARGIRVVAVSSNDVATYPEDGPEAMQRFAAEHGFAFPYLYDASQQLAIDFGAVCTPDFFVYDADGLLVYRGQFDGTRPRTPHTVSNPGAGVVATGVDLQRALDALLAGTGPVADQRPSQGCSMKWKPGMDPDESN
jgi:peroxiredoxin